MRITGELVLLVLAGVFVVNAVLVGLPLRRLARRVYPDSLLLTLALVPGLSFVALWWLAFAGGERVQRRSSIQVPAGDVT
ncbi:MAG: hypothetical protein IPJ98_05500 [Bryobacterales bacterium]|nr:hypothetical protein [Bryobacterales bacterium]